MCVVMKIVGICGSPKMRDSNTRFLLEEAMAAASETLADAEIGDYVAVVLNLVEYEIRRCTGCDACVRKKPCPESDQDDMGKIEDELRSADGIIIAAPSYFTSVPGLLKDFMDRSRPMKMNDHELKDRVFSAITYAGLRYGGQEPVIDLLNRYALTQGMVVVGAVGSPVKSGFSGVGSMQTDDGKWRTSEKDQLAIDASRLVGERVAKMMLQLRG
ncbi:flavodoxin family protein [Candidatus Thorarchaeota archaeon]|nr:MAG: flavodoxin family protein [Candidatus Thorarchaeota archaeon]